jgi:hypothetical protein
VINSKIFSRFAVAILIVFAFALVAIPAAQANKILIGVEDISLRNNSDKDYNDMGVMFSAPGLDIVASGPGAWQAMVAPDENGIPYWDNTSWDGSQQNIGYFVTGTGAFSADPNSPKWSIAETLYWGIGTSYDNNFMLLSTGGVASTILCEVAGWAGSNALYWSTNGVNFNLLFPGSALVGATAAFNPGGQNFILRAITPGGTFDTGAMGACGHGEGKQFAAFTQVPSQVPIPAAIWLLGAGLMGLVGIRRKVRS